MYKPVYAYTAKRCVFNFTNGFMLYQWFKGSVVVEQFVHNLPEWCKAAGVPLSSIAIID